MNNLKLAMISDIQKVSYKDRQIASSFNKIEFADFAKIMGAEGYYVDKPNQIGSIIEKSLKNKRPVVIDVLIDPEETPPLKPRMLAMRRSMGLPSLADSFSWQGIKELFDMTRNH